MPKPTEDREVQLLLEHSNRPRQPFKDAPVLDPTMVLDRGGMVDLDTMKIGGFLYQKKGDNNYKSSWVKLWCVIEHEVDCRRSYGLTRYDEREDFIEERTVGTTIELAGARVVLHDGEKKGRLWELVLVLAGGQPLMFGAETEKDFRQWAITLHLASEIATARLNNIKQIKKDIKDSSQTVALLRNNVAATPQDRPRHAAMRLHVDLDSLPINSEARSKFLQAFQQDLAMVAGGVAVDRVKVHRIKRSPDMNWLTVVEWTLSPGEGADPWELEKRYRTIKEALLNKSSDLYRGQVTCNIDPSYVHVPMPSEDSEAVPISPDVKVRSILDKYLDDDLTQVDIERKCRFQIKVSFEGRVRPLWVLNPRLFRKKTCFVWPHDIKAALGIVGTVQDAWLEVVSLIPQGVPSSLVVPVVFEELPGSGGLPVVDGRFLKAGLTYGVEFKDTRHDSINTLGDEEHKALLERFHSLAVDGDQTISREEYVCACKKRTEDLKAKLEVQFSSEDNANRLREAERQRQAAFDKLEAHERKLFRMFDSAEEAGGDGRVSLKEYLLAEAWWRRSVLSPEKLAFF